MIDKYIGKLNLRYGAFGYLEWALHKGMKGLREICSHPELTMYWARHSFGMIARNKCRLSVDDVAVALNHIDNGHKTTDIYIEKDWGIVDDVQQEVLSLLNFTSSNKLITNLNPEQSRKIMRLIGG